MTHTNQERVHFTIPLRRLLSPEGGQLISVLAAALSLSQKHRDGLCNYVERARRAVDYRSLQDPEFLVPVSAYACFIVMRANEGLNNGIKELNAVLLPAKPPEPLRLRICTT